MFALGWRCPKSWEIEVLEYVHIPRRTSTQKHHMGLLLLLIIPSKPNHNSCYAGRWLNIQILFLLSLMWFDLWVKTSFLIEFSLSRQITRCVEALPNCFCSCPISQALPCGLHVNEWSTISTISNLFGNQINHDKHKTLGLCMHACIWWSITCK